MGLTGQSIRLPGDEEIHLNVGVFMFPTDRTPPVRAVARAVEDRGFDLILFPEHTHIPVARTQLGPSGGVLHEEHRRSLDPFVAATEAAVVTSRLLIGTGVCLVAQHDALTLAKTVASVDHVSGGRFLFGIGHGWHPEEISNHAVDPARRRDVAREKVRALRALWTQEETEWAGEFVRFTPVWSWPKPVQRPAPPVLLGGGAHDRLLADVIEIADGWMPYAYLHDVAAGWPRLLELAAAAGRDPATLELAVMGCRPSAQDVQAYLELGASRVVFDMPGSDWANYERRLDRYAELLKVAK